MKLFGSKTSPFVRRIRLQLQAEPYEFAVVDVYSKDDRPKLLAANPVGRIPVLEDDGVVIRDSRLITRYLRDKNGAPTLGLQDELELDLMDNAQDTGVLLFQIRKFSLDEKWENPYCRLQVERLDRLLHEIKVPAEDWGLKTIYLYCLLDWLAFRQVTKLEKYPALQAFHSKYQTNKWIQATDPRL